MAEDAKLNAASLMEMASTIGDAHEAQHAGNGTNAFMTEARFDEARTSLPAPTAALLSQRHAPNTQRGKTSPHDNS